MLRPSVSSHTEDNLKRSKNEDHPPPYNQGLDNIGETDSDNEDSQDDRTSYEHTLTPTNLSRTPANTRSPAFVVDEDNEIEGEPLNSDDENHEECDPDEAAREARLEKLRQKQKRPAESLHSSPINSNSLGQSTRGVSTPARPQSKSTQRNRMRNGRRNLRAARGIGGLQRLEQNLQSLTKKFNKFVAASNRREKTNERKFPNLTESVVLENKKEVSMKAY